MLPQRKPQYKDHKHVEEDDDTQHLLSSTDSYNLQYRERGVFYTNGKEHGNNNNGNGVNLGANKYAKDAISLNSPVLSKTPLPVIGGKHPIYINTKFNWACYVTNCIFTYPKYYIWSCCQYCMPSRYKTVGTCIDWI